jgi:hypothetical protein
MDGLAIFLGLIVIRADDILRIECHLAVETGTNSRFFFDGICLLPYSWSIVKWC